MNKADFLLALSEKLSFLPREDVKERLSFYSEMIDDRMEEGLSEEEAAAAVGSIDEIAAQIAADTPFSKIARKTIRSGRRLSTAEIILLTLGSPVWIPLGIAAVAVILSLYVSLWAVIISLWAVFISLAAGIIGGVFAGIVLSVTDSFFAGIIMICAGLICAGLSIFMFFGCRAVSKGMLILTKKTAVRTKKCFIKEEEA